MNPTIRETVTLLSKKSFISKRFIWNFCLKEFERTFASRKLYNSLKKQTMNVKHEIDYTENFYTCQEED